MTDLIIGSLSLALAVVLTFGVVAATLRARVAGEATPSTPSTSSAAADANP